MLLYFVELCGFEFVTSLYLYIFLQVLINSIENEGFNIQKTGTFDIEHAYSKNYNALKVHYFLIQFAHTIRKLLEKGLKYIKELKMSIKEVSAAITQTLTYKIFAHFKKTLPNMEIEKIYYTKRLLK